MFLNTNPSSSLQFPFDHQVTCRARTEPQCPAWSALRLLVILASASHVFFIKVGDGNRCLGRGIITLDPLPLRESGSPPLEMRFLLMTYRLRTAKSYVPHSM